MRFFKTFQKYLANAMYAMYAIFRLIFEKWKWKIWVMKELAKYLAYAKFG